MDWSEDEIIALMAAFEEVKLPVHPLLFEAFRALLPEGPTRSLASFAGKMQRRWPKQKFYWSKEKYDRAQADPVSADVDRVLAHAERSDRMRVAQPSAPMISGLPLFTKTETTYSLLNRSVDEFDFSARTRNCLEQMNIRYVGELVQKTAYELSQQRNLGRKSLREIRQALDRMGFVLGMNVEWPPSAPTKNDTAAKRKRLTGINLEKEIAGWWAEQPPDSELHTLTILNALGAKGIQADPGAIGKAMVNLGFGKTQLKKPGMALLTYYMPPPEFLPLLDEPTPERVSSLPVENVAPLLPPDEPASIKDFEKARRRSEDVSKQQHEEVMEALMLIAESLSDIRTRLDRTETSTATYIAQKKAKWEILLKRLESPKRTKDDQ